MKTKFNFIKEEIRKNYLVDKTKLAFYLSYIIRKRSLQCIQFSIYSYTNNDADKLLMRLKELSFVKSSEVIRLGDVHLIIVRTTPFRITLSKLHKRSKKVLRLAIKYSSTYSAWELLRDENCSKKSQ
jgi:hypothetical protein